MKQRADVLLMEFHVAIDIPRQSKISSKFNFFCGFFFVTEKF